MSQIDKAFLSAYAKKRPSKVTSTEVSSLVDVTGDRLVKLHSGSPSTETLQPHIAASPVKRPASAEENISANSVNISNPSVRIASSTSIRQDLKKEIPSEIPPLAPAKPTRENVESNPRKTLTSYLQQARQPTALPASSTRWTPAEPTPAEPTLAVAKTPESQSPTGQRPPFQSDLRNASQGQVQAPFQTDSSKFFRVDTPHSGNPPVSRPESTLPWSFGMVERSIKATADSKSVSARTSNEYKPGNNSTAEKPADEPKFTSPILSKPESSKTSKASPTIESHGRAAPLSKSLNSDRLAKITLPIQPVWEVDDFLWPAAASSLLATQADAFHEIGLHLQHAQSKGLRVLSITSGERGVGRSTTAMCLAKTLSKLGLRIGLVDGDYECPSLFDQLNLEAPNGWQQCLLENIALDEVAIHSANEAITFFPLTDSISPSQIAVHSIRINKLLKRIANACDMVIIDANRLTQKQSQLLGTGDEAVLDAALLIVDAELSLRQRVDAAIDMVRHQGVQSIGLVENFHS